MKKKLLATLLTAAMVVSGVTPVLAAPTPGSADATVYGAEDIIEVVVPTSYEFAINPLGVDVKTARLSGKTQILSGTYAIQNRSTIPVNVEAKFEVAAGEATPTGGSATPINVGGKAAVEADDAMDISDGIPTLYLGLLTSAKGSAVTLAKKTDALLETAGGTDIATATDNKIATVDAGSLDNKDLKVAKLATTPIDLTTKGVTDGATNKGAVLKFALAAGPFDAKFVAGDPTKTGKDKTDHVEYVEKNTTGFDAVGFTFTGAVSTTAQEWANVTTVPKVTVTYTVSQSTKAKYAGTFFDPVYKDLIVESGDVTVGSSATHSFPVEPTGLTPKKDPDTKKPLAGTVDDSNAVTILSLKAGSKAVKSTLGDVGTYTPAVKDDPETSNDETAQAQLVIKDSFATDLKLDEGFYQVTFGKQSFIMEIPGEEPEEP